MTYLNFNKHGVVELQESSQEKRMHASLEGYFTLRKYDALSGRLVQELSFRNEIMNTGLERFKDAGAIIQQFHVGTGTAAPTFADMTMGNRIASCQGSVNVRAANVGTDRYASTVWTGRFAAGAISTNITEVGGGVTTGVYTSAPNPSSGYLWCRQLIKDVSGNPVALTVLPTEYLDVSYELRAYPNLTPVAGTLSLTGGSSYSFTCRASYLNNWKIEAAQNTPVGSYAYVYYGSDSASAVGVMPSSYTDEHIGVSAGVRAVSSWGAGSLEPYVANSYKRVCSGSALSTSNGNFASGILGANLKAVFNTSNYYPGVLETYHLVVFNDKIPKTPTNTLTVRTEMQWSRRILP